MSRDMSKAQFAAALKRHDMTPCGFMGYVTVVKYPSGGSLQVSRHNAGENRRAQLAYLLREKEKELAKDAARVRVGGAK